MKPSETTGSTRVSPREHRGPYSSPRLKSLSPADARDLLLRHSDPNDAEIKFMLECIERLKGSVDG
jgi:hypothetical protein